jgi:hypothetical protein
LYFQPYEFMYVVMETEGEREKCWWWEGREMILPEA